MPSTATDESAWTACTSACRHGGPYRVSYRGSLEPDRTFLVGEHGAPVAFAFLDPPEPVLITAPRPHPHA